MGANLQQIDQALGDRFTEITTAMQGYFDTHGRFPQLLRTHLEIPPKGQQKAPDNLQATPTDSTVKWSGLGQLPSTMLSRMRIDVYNGPGGHGYVVVNEAIDDADIIYEKATNVGPETWRSFDWRSKEVVP